MTTTTIKKYYPSFRRYYARRRFYRRYKYTVGRGNYFCTRADLSGTISFANTSAQPIFHIGNNTYNSIWIYGILSSVNAALLGAFDQRKVKGFRLEVVPANDKTIASTSDACPVLVAGISHAPDDTGFNQLVDNNKSIMLNPQNKVSAYWPVRNDWTSNDPDTHDDGCLCVFSSKNASDTDYPRIYSFKISIYVVYRNSSRW